MNIGQLKSISSNSGISCIGFDLEGAIVYSSEKFLSVFSTETESISKTAQLFDQHPELYRAYLKATKGLNSSIEVKIKDKYYIVELLFKSSLIKQADIVAIFTDITYLKCKEEELNQKVKRLEGLNKELEHFAYVTSHDLREPFRTATIFAQLIEKKHASNLDAEANSYLQYIINGTKNGQHLVNDLLTYYRTCKAQIEPVVVEPEEIIISQFYSLKETIDTKDAIININPKEALYADPEWLGTIFYQLIKNAIIHNSASQPILNISVTSLDNKHIITIQDNGVGIDKEHHETIFQLLLKIGSRPNLDGSGVGLSICKKIVDLHGGKIGLESELGNGSKFIISLPKSVS